MNIQNDTKLAYSINEAAAAISIGRSRIYELLAEGRLESRTIGKRRVILAASLRRLLEAA